MLYLDVHLESDDMLLNLPDMGHTNFIREWGSPAYFVVQLLPRILFDMFRLQHGLRQELLEFVNLRLAFQAVTHLLCG